MLKRLLIAIQAIINIAHIGFELSALDRLRSRQHTPCSARCMESVIIPAHLCKRVHLMFLYDCGFGYEPSGAHRGHGLLIKGIGLCVITQMMEYSRAARFGESD